MNAPATFPEGHPTDTLHGVARGIQAGIYPRFDEQLYEPTDWLSGADELLNEDNPFELDFMLARAECWVRFVRWQRNNPHRNEDFGSWLADMAAWNRPNIYERAMTNRERGLVSQGGGR